ncbi:MAG: 30S ribosomal protein S18 [Candidatus Andersenbacteria bacterium]|nr:30S ribosomal protein S18 [Candidatus Andersenbacteria bacterium]MBI3251180.1 30S ribosomal protein S18 [Candidatus Andersenbacteria bacterium]
MKRPKTRSRQKKSIEQLLQAEVLDQVTFRDTELLRLFISTQGKILPRRKTGITARHQRKIAREIKQAREMGLIKYRGQE